MGNYIKRDIKNTATIKNSIPHDPNPDKYGDIYPIHQAILKEKISSYMKKIIEGGMKKSY